MVWHVHIIALDVEVLVRQVDAPGYARGFHFAVLLPQRRSKSCLALGLVILIVKIHFVKRTLLGVAVQHAILRYVVR